MWWRETVNRPGEAGAKPGAVLTFGGLSLRGEVVACGAATITVRRPSGMVAVCLAPAARSTNGLVIATGWWQGSSP
jgi:hypothetical protein